MGFSHDKFLKVNTERGDYPIPCGHTGKGGQKGWIFSPEGTAPCLPASQYKDPTKVILYEAIQDN